MDYNYSMVKKLLILFASLALVIAGCFYNALKVNTKQFRIREEYLDSEKIAQGSDGLLIAYFSDIKLNPLLDETYIDAFLNAVDSFKPDIILFGGDLLDCDQRPGAELVTHLTTGLKKLHAPYGKYAVYGDEDHADKATVDAVYEQSGFKVLDNTSVLIGLDKGSYLNIVGIDSMSKGTPDLASAFAQVNANHYSIVLSHCPDIFDSILGYPADQLLSGHSLGGQIYFPLLSSFDRDYGCKKYYRSKTTRNGVTLDISAGLGRKSVNARFNADAEIVVYTLRSPIRSTGE